MKKYFVFILGTLMLLASCKKDHSTLLTAQDFPSSVGSWWKYQMTFTNRSTYDTAIVTIVDTIVRNGNTWQRWVQNQSGPDYNNWTDTMYVILNATSIAFYTEPVSGFSYLTINFPVIDNEAWGSAADGGSYTTSVQNITVGGTSYNGAACLSETYSSGAPSNLNTTISYWIEKNVGIVKHDLDYPLQQGQEHYSLISYHIN
jgi:hypothetical protein